MPFHPAQDRAHVRKGCLEVPTDSDIARVLLPEFSKVGLGLSESRLGLLVLPSRPQQVRSLIGVGACESVAVVDLVGEFLDERLPYLERSQRSGLGFREPMLQGQLVTQFVQGPGQPISKRSDQGESDTQLRQLVI